MRWKGCCGYLPSLGKALQPGLLRTARGDKRRSSLGGARVFHCHSRPVVTTKSAFNARMLCTAFAEGAGYQAQNTRPIQAPRRIVAV